MRARRVPGPGTDRDDQPSSAASVRGCAVGSVRPSRRACAPLDAAAGAPTAIGRTGRAGSDGCGNGFRRVVERLILLPGAPRPPAVPSVIRCALNPEDIRLTQHANLAERAEPLMLGGGGTAPSVGFAGAPVTTLTIRLLFEAPLDQNGGSMHDVRRLTAPLYRLAQRPLPGVDRPCPVDLVWGKHWSFRGTIGRLSELLDHFSAAGVATRSWTTLELRGMPLLTPTPMSAAASSLPEPLR